MYKKILIFLLPLLMLTASASFAAVKFNVDDVDATGVSQGDPVEIEVKIENFEDYLAGEFILDFGQAGNFTEFTIENGDVYAKLVDYGQFGDDALLTEWEALNTWYADDDDAFAVDWIKVGSQLKVYIYAPDAAPKTDGTLFTIKGSLGADAKPVLMSFGGDLLNFQQNTRDLASKSVTSFLMDNVYGDELDDADKPKNVDDFTDEQLKDFKSPVQVPVNGIITKPVTLTPKDPDPQQPPLVQAVKPKVSIQQNTTIYMDKAKTTPFTGAITSPKALTQAEIDEKKGQFSGEFAKWADDEDLVLFSMGAATKLYLDKPVLVTLEVDRKNDKFKIYYLPPNGDPEPAGIDWADNVGIDNADLEAQDGWKSKDKQISDIKQGGIIFATTDSAQDGYTKYEVAVLMDHMSIFAAAPAPAAPKKDDRSSDCFIATAAFGSFLNPHVVVLREFRDQYLLTNSGGTMFVEAYYQTSPPFAAFIAEHASLRMITQVALIPFLAIAYLMTATGMGWMGLALLTGLIGLTPVLYRMKRSEQPA